MIKVGKFFYIHYTTVLLFVICWLTRRLEWLFLSYFSVFLHETAHTIAAKLIGIEPSYIAFFPFGVNLRVKSRILYSISDEILLYMSGPLLNAILALFIQIFFAKTAYSSYFYWNNVGLFVFNLLPILPMDGGMVLKRILSDKMGNKGAEKVLKAISMAMISLLAAAEALLLIKNSFNFSLLFVIVFLTANIFTNTEKYSTNLVKELLYIKEKQKKCVVKAEVLLVNDDYPKRKIAESFNASKCYVVLEKSKNGKIKKIFTEEEIIDAILKKP